MAQTKAVRGPFTINGRSNLYVEVDRKRRSLGTSDVKKAKKIVAGLKAKYRTQEMGQEESRDQTSFKTFRKQYLEWAEKTQPVKTFKANRLALDKLEPYCKDLTLDEIGAYHLDQVIADHSKRLKPTSINCYIRHAKSTFAQAVKWGLVAKHPFKDCKQLRVTKKPPKAIDKDGIQDLFSVILDCYDCLLVRAYLVTGRSRAELVRLSWRDVDFKKNRYFITRTKTHLSKWYPMGGAFREVLQAIGPEKRGFVFWRRYHPDTITHKIKDYMIEAGLGRYHLHNLRHSFSRLYLDTGGSIYALQQLLGHSQVSTTMVYSSMGDKALADEINKVDI
jgi:integrase